MGESVVIHKNVKIPKAAKIKANEVVVITPSSFDLYQICERHVTDDEYEMVFVFFCKVKAQSSDR